MFAVLTSLVLLISNSVLTSDVSDAVHPLSDVTMIVLTSLLFLTTSVLTSDVRGAVHLLCGVNARLEKSSGKKSPFIIESEDENPPGTWPWACSVGFGDENDWEHQCGGTVVGSRHLVTAAHCPITFEGWRKADIIRCVWIGRDVMRYSF